MIKVYIASPYTLGDVAVNVRKQMLIADYLITMGYAPFVPLYSHFQHIFSLRPYEDWIKLDRQWLYQCDCVLRLPGESKGADEEVKYAKSVGISVFYSINELAEHYKYDKRAKDI